MHQYSQGSISIPGVSDSGILNSEVALELPMSISEAVPTPSGGEQTISSTTGTPPEVIFGDNDMPLL